MEMNLNCSPLQPLKKWAIVLQKSKCDDWDNKFLAPQYVTRVITFIETRPIPLLEMGKVEAY
jgi:hypothetical protein